MGVHVLSDRLVIAVVCDAEQQGPGVFGWVVTDDVGTSYKFAGSGAGGGNDGMSFGGVGFRPRPPETATRLFIRSQGSVTELDLASAWWHL